MKHRLLVVDDDESSRLSLAEFLRKSGFRVGDFPDATQAAAEAGRTPFDLAIADIRMSGNERLEFVEFCHSVRPSLPVILVTGFPGVETALAAMKMQAAAYLVKPLDLDHLLDLVKKTLQRAALEQGIHSLSQRLSSCQRDLQAVEQHLRLSPGPVLKEPFEAYFAVCFESVLANLESLRDVAVSARLSGPGGRPEAAPTTPLLILEALRDTIDVLEKTKDSFRSKELADLRRRLEKLLASDRRLAAAKAAGRAAENVFAQ